MKNKEFTFKIKENQPYMIGGDSGNNFWIKGDKEVSQHHAKIDLR